MSATILGYLKNAQKLLIDLETTGIAEACGKQQLKDAIMLLKKGYLPYTNIEPLLEKYKSIRNVPVYENKELTTEELKKDKIIMSTTILGCLQDANNLLYTLEAIGVAEAFGRHQLNKSVMLLEKGYPILTPVEPLLEKYESIDNVPVCEDNEEKVNVKSANMTWPQLLSHQAESELPPSRDKKKELILLKSWNKTIHKLPIDAFPAIPLNGDRIDLGPVLWEGEELKNTYIPGCKESIYYVVSVTLGFSYVILQISKTDPNAMMQKKG